MGMDGYPSIGKYFNAIDFSWGHLILDLGLTKRHCVFTLHLALTTNMRFFYSCLSVWQLGIRLEQACAKVFNKYGVANSSRLFQNRIILYNYRIVGVAYFKPEVLIKYYAVF